MDASRARHLSARLAARGRRAYPLVLTHLEVPVQRVLAACLALALAAPASAQAPVGKDADVLQGIRQVEDGDYDAAILTLDNAARRLSADPTRARELSQAYLYLGVAYVGKGHEAAAKAKFREAVIQLH